MLNRRELGLGAAAFAIAACAKTSTAAPTDEVTLETKMTDNNIADNIDWAALSDTDWKSRLSDMQYRVLRHEATERPGSSPLNHNKAKGRYVCAGCALPLFTSEMKFDSGTGWPSFFDVMPNAVGTKIDKKLFSARTEYHCARCGGHQGHIFNDGPRPTGLRYCNNGVALNFVQS